MRMSFASSVEEWCRKTRLSGAVVMRKLALDGLNGVVKMSPVDTGRFRGNWRVSINKVDLSVVTTGFGESSIAGSRYRKANAASAAKTSIDAGQLPVSKTTWGDAIYVSNNLPYAIALEDGHSKQAPRGMLKVTFMRLKSSLVQLVAQAHNLPPPPQSP